MDEKRLIDSIRFFMLGEDKDLKIAIYEDEVCFYLWEKEVGIYLNKYYNEYHPYIDLEGYYTDKAKLTFDEIKIIHDAMTVIENNLDYVLSWINVAKK